MRRQAAAVALQILDRSKVGMVKELLKDLPKDYPNAAEWLDRRLDDNLNGQGECWVATYEARVVGVSILTPKISSLKLSTLYVRSKYRGYGLGKMLMRRAIKSANSSGFDEVYLTVAEHTIPIVLPLLISCGFTNIALERHRYGRGRHEGIFSRLEM